MLVGQGVGQIGKFLSETNHLGLRGNIVQVEVALVVALVLTVRALDVHIIKDERLEQGSVCFLERKFKSFFN